MNNSYTQLLKGKIEINATNPWNRPLNHFICISNKEHLSLCCDCCLQFTNCLRIVLIHIILEIPPQIKYGGGFKFKFKPTQFHTSC